MWDDSIVVGEQAHVALWLASAAAMSGGMWQPFVNFFQAEGLELSFNAAMGATLVACGSMFYTGLRAGRYFYGAVLTVRIRPFCLTRHVSPFARSARRHRLL